MSYVFGMNMQMMVAVSYPYLLYVASSDRASAISALSSMSFLLSSAASLSVVLTEGIVRLTGVCIPFFRCLNIARALCPGVMA